MAKPRMTAEQWARFQDLQAVMSHPMNYQRDFNESRHAEYLDLRDNYAPPPQLPSEGSPATYSIGSDRYKATVDLVSKGGREIWVKVHGLGGMMFTYRPSDGAYREKGLPCGRLTLGVAEEYMDPSF